MTRQTTYPTEFAGPRRACAIPASCSGKGTIAWSRELELPDAGPPRSLMIWQDHVVATMYDRVIVFASDGERRWERRRLPGSPPAIANDLLYYETGACKLDAVTLANEIALDGVPLPGAMNEDFGVQLLWPMESGFLTVVYWPGHQFDQKPEVGWRLTAYGERVADAGGDYEAIRQLPPLFIPELGRLILSLYDREALCVEIERENTGPRFQIPLAELTDWSADTEGTLCIIGYKGDRKTMVALSPAGEERWRWMDHEASDRWVTGQPPIRFGNQRVYALTRGSVLAIERGQVLWQHQVKAGVLGRGSSLADGSILATAGKTLFHLDGTGNERFAISLEAEILTTPVVDAEGNVYVATAERLFQIR